MGLLDNIIGSTVGKVVGQVMNAVERFTGSKAMDSESAAQKRLLEVEVMKIVQDRDSEVEQTLRVEYGAKERIMVAEMQQGDTYTKRARPTIIYSGLLMVFLDMASRAISYFMNIDAPLASSFISPAFMYTWGAVAGIYSIGRTAEKRGNTSAIVASITGS